MRQCVFAWDNETVCVFCLFFAVARCCGRTCGRLTPIALRKQTRASNQVGLGVGGEFRLWRSKMLQNIWTAPRLLTGSERLWAGLCCDRKHRSGCGETAKKRGSFCFRSSECSSRSGSSSRQAPVTAESIFIWSPHQAFYIVPPFFSSSLLAEAPTLS